MPQKIINVPGVGAVLVVRLRKSKSVRLSISPVGKVRVSQPYWAPYAAGASFARRKTAWIQKQLASNKPILLRDGMRIGKHHYLYFRDRSQATIKDKNIIVPIGKGASSASTQKRTLAACEKALKFEAQSLLPQRLEQLADNYGLSYSDVIIRKLTARWGSCSSHKVITLNYFLVQLPWHLIDYVLIHELIHTKHLHHGSDFWLEFLKIEPHARQYQKDIKQHQPRVEPVVP